MPFAAANCIPVPGEPGDDHEDDFVLLADALVTGWHATELAAVRAGCTVAVFGAGAVGLLAAYSARLKGAAEVYVVDVPERLDKAGRAPGQARARRWTELAALVYLAGAVTAVVFLAWFAAVERLGVERTGLFNGLIPVASLIAVAVSGTETVTSVRLVGATGVLAGLFLGLSTDRGDRHGRPR